MRSFDEQYPPELKFKLYGFTEGNEIIHQCVEYLEHLDFSKVDIAILVWGVKGLLCAPPECVPDDVKRLLQDFRQEQEKEKSSLDSIDKKLHRIQAELLQCMIKKRLENQIEILERKDNPCGHQYF